MAVSSGCSRKNWCFSMVNWDSLPEANDFKKVLIKSAGMVHFYILQEDNSEVAPVMFDSEMDNPNFIGKSSDNIYFYGPWLS